MADAPVSVAVAGCGIGAQHLEAYAALPEAFAVAALVDRDLARALPLAQRFGVPRVVQEFPDLWTVDDLPVDAVDICLPPMDHEAAIRLALEHGAHVICEKPIVGSLPALDAVAGQASAADRVVMPVFQYRYGRGLGKLRHLIAEGLTGRPLLAHVDVHWDRDDGYFAVPWRRTQAGSYGGILIIHTIHFLDLLIEVLGPVASVGARTGSPAFGLEVEDTAVLWAGTASGALATLSATLGAAGNLSRLRFCFEHVTAESDADAYAPANDPWTFAARGADRQAAIDAALADFNAGPQATAPAGYVRLLQGFHRAIRSGDPPEVTLTDARRTLELLAAAYASASDAGRPIPLPLDPASPLYMASPVAEAAP